MIAAWGSSACAVWNAEFPLPMISTLWQRTPLQLWTWPRNRWPAQCQECRDVRSAPSGRHNHTLCPQNLLCGVYDELATCFLDPVNASSESHVEGMFTVEVC